MSLREISKAAQHLEQLIDHLTINVMENEQLQKEISEIGVQCDQLVQRIDQFEAHCDGAEYTDTSDAWVFVMRCWMLFNEIRGERPA